MNKINLANVTEETWSSPKGTFSGIYKGISIALGRNPESTDVRHRHPFDVELCRIPAGKKNCPYHSHAAQFEFYMIIGGKGVVRDERGETAIEAGDAFFFHPGEAHQLINNSDEELILYVIADNPIGDSCYYPDSRKWCVTSPEKQFIRSEALSFEDGEE
jgi:uncharacterized cupin superfamily protein